MQGTEEEGAQAEGGDGSERFVVLLVMAGLRLSSKPERGEDSVT